MKLFILTALLISLSLANPLNKSELLFKDQQDVVDSFYSNGYIIGGTAATAGQAPYIVSLQRSSSHFCGGTIVDASWIVTAAHCVSG